RERMNDDANFNRYVRFREVVQPMERFLEGPGCLNDKVVLVVDVRVQRNAEHQIVMLNRTELLRKSEAPEQASVCEDMDGFRRKLLLRLFDNAKEIVAQQRRLTTADRQLVTIRIDQFQKSQNVPNPVGVVDVLR